VHFINQDTQSPPINGLTMALVEDNLWRNILWSSTNGKGSSFIQDFSKSEVGKLEITIISNEQVLRLEVSEDDILAVEVLEASGDSSAIKPCLVGSKGFDGSEVSEELTPIDKLQNQVQVF
jgi:hypothetical protein